MFTSKKQNPQTNRTPILATAHASRRRIGLLGGLLLLAIAGPLSPAAHGASATKAVWSGAGTYTDPATGQVYGKGGTATLAVTTSTDANCAMASSVGSEVTRISSAG